MKKKEIKILDDILDSVYEYHMGSIYKTPKVKGLINLFLNEEIKEILDSGDPWEAYNFLRKYYQETVKDETRKSPNNNSN